MVKELKNMGAATICIKDMAGIMGPQEAYDMVSAIKDAVDLPIDLHTHSTTGLAFMTYLKAVENGMDVIRIFDALNDVNNMKVAMEATNKAGAIASGTISYTTSPVHTHKKYVEMVKELKEMGASTICIKDMAGIMGPQEAYDMVSAIKDAVPGMPIDLHTHSTTGLATRAQTAQIIYKFLTF
jgi:pyruvate/oxaloacetate carboxyltransferase